MQWYLVRREEFSGYDCNGHWVNHIVAANSSEEAVAMYKTEYEGDIIKVIEFELPDISRKKKPRELCMTGRALIIDWS